MATPTPAPSLNTKELSARLSKRLANFTLGENVISALADRVMIDGLSIVKFDPCIYGICIDYFSDKMPRLENVLTVDRGIRRLDIFPYGIIQLDRYHVQIAFNVDELEGKGLNREFGH